MRFIGVIPARYASTRFPGKPLAKMLGKPMIQWVIEGAAKGRHLSELIVATDHEQIAEVSRAAGAKVVMTASDLPSGTDRIFAATQNLNYDVVVNIQGDEPLVTGDLIDRLCDLFLQNPRLDMATLAHPLLTDELDSLNSVKVVVNHQDEALYFSRYPIPYSRMRAQPGEPITGSLKHIGMYAYKKEFLKSFCETDPVEIEKAESLEQLRALYLGAKIKVLRVAEASLGVDTPEDLVKIEKLMRNK